MMRGIRGAVQVEANRRDTILDAAEKLIRALMEANGIHARNVASVFFTVTSDLNAAFPAEVRTRIGWELVPFLCAQEIAVPDAMPRVLRVLALIETELSQEEIKHCYLGEARKLRPDLERRL
jgi:chorismate mutase